MAGAVQTPGRAPALRPVHKQLRWSGLRTVGALVLREMASSYGRSPGGYLWMILEPVLGILAISLFFMLVGFRTPRLGTNFPIYFASGMLPFALYMDLSGKVAQAINYSKSLLAYPRVTYVDAILARAGLAILTQLLVGIILFTSIRMLWDTRTVISMDRIMLSYAMAIALGLGVGLINCFLMTRFQLWQRVWSILTRPLFFVSGILIIYESIPAPWNGYFLWNPLMHVTAEMRAGFYVGYDAVYVSPLFVFGVSLVLGLAGMISLYRHHRDMLEI